MFLRIRKYVSHSAALSKFFLVNWFFRLYLLAFNFSQFINRRTDEAMAPAPSAVSRRVGWYTFYTSRFVPGSTCLSRALTAQFSLARKGYGSQIKVGVSIDPEKENAVLAHAWLTSGSVVVVGNEDSELERFKEILNTSKNSK